VDPETLAGDLPIAQQQMVEIGRALTRNARVIIMDEPTSSLTDKETEILFQLIRELKENGVSIIYISHKLDEVLEISDRITVLCDGRNVTMVSAADTNRKQLIEYMLGRTLEDLFNKVPAPRGDAVLEVKGLTRKGVFEDVSFRLYAGEVLGFFGLVGAGRSEIMQAVFGIDKYDAGEILVEGKPVRIRSSKDAIACGLALVTEDRKRSGLALEQSVMENITLPQLPRLKKGLFIDARERQRLTEKYIEDIRVKTPSSAQLVGNLSGGNQQKVVLSKWLMGHPKVLILDEPTRGIDVGSKSEIYGLISELASEGVGVILVSSEMSEILGVSDRIITIHEGRIAAEFITKEATDRQILAAAFGGKNDDENE
jgi:ABC-type sugar transport system ATPase subunit